jgi:hypothetical protein
MRRLYRVPDSLTNPQQRTQTGRLNAYDEVSRRWRAHFPRPNAVIGGRFGEGTRRLLRSAARSILRLNRLSSEVGHSDRQAEKVEIHQLRRR